MPVKKIGKAILDESFLGGFSRNGFRVEGEGRSVLKQKYYKGGVGEYVDILKKSFVTPIQLSLENNEDDNYFKYNTLIYCLYRGYIYKFDRPNYTPEEMTLQIMELEDKERQKFERLKHQFNEAEKIEKEAKRQPIPEVVRIAVWRRDEGKCVKCGSRENLEYDHIIPGL